MNDKVFDISAMKSLDEDELEIKHGDNLTGWKWRIAGPGHPKTVAQSNRIARDRLNRQAAQEQAQVNGKKWKQDAETPDEARDRNILLVKERLLGWNTVNYNGRPFEFNEENVVEILRDMTLKPSPLLQALEFIGEDNSFTARSGKNSGHSQKDVSNSTKTKKDEQGATA